MDGLIVNRMLRAAAGQFSVVHDRGNAPAGSPAGTAPELSRSNHRDRTIATENDELSQSEDDSKRAIFSACWYWYGRMLDSFSRRASRRWRCGSFLCFTFPRSWTIRGSTPISPKTG